MIALSSISHWQIARRLSAIPTEALQALFQELVRQAGTKIGFAKIRDSVGHIYLIDASVISLYLSRYRWAEFRKTKSGVKLHLRLRLFEQGVFPDWAKITPAKPAENQLYIALITYCLLMILQLDTGVKGPLLTVKRLLRVCLYEPVDVFLKN